MGERDQFSSVKVSPRPVARPESEPENFAPKSPRKAAAVAKPTWKKTGRRFQLRHGLNRILAGIRNDLAEEAAFGHLFLWLPVLLGTGSVIWFSTPTEIPLQTVLLLLSIAVSILALNYRTRGAVWSAGLALIWISVGMILAKFETTRFETTILDSPVTTHISGTLIDRERMDKGQWRYVLTNLETTDPTIKRPPETITVVGRIHDRPARLGETVTGLARLSPPSGPVLPELNNFGFDAYFSGNGAVGYFYGAPEIKAQDPAKSREVGLWDVTVNRLNAIRGAIGTRIQSVLPGDTGAFATSMVTDERRAISKETTEALRLSGLAHIVAISGLNMALASGIFFIGFRSVLSVIPGIAYRFNIKKFAAAGALAGLVAYYLISGSAVSAERAFIMMAVILIAVFLDRPSISLRNVALSATLILIMAPSAIMGPSFQMSFAATLALVSGYHVFKKIPKPENPLAVFSISRFLAPITHFFGGILLTSAIGGASTAIFSIEHFHRVAAYGLPANLIAMPVVSFIVMPFGLIAMLLMPFGLDEIPLRIMGFGLDITIAVAKYVSSFGGNVVTGRLEPWFFPMASAGFIIMCIFRTRLRLLGVTIFCMAIVGQILSPARHEADLIIYEDGTLAAKVEPNHLNVNVTKPPDFIFTQMQYGLAITDFEGPTPVAALSLQKKKKGEKRQPLTFQQRYTVQSSMLDALSKNDGHFSCAAKQWCVVSVRNIANIVLVQDPIFTGIACDVADIVVVAAPLKYKTCNSGSLLITRDTLRKRGSLEITLPKTVETFKTREDFLDNLKITGALDGVTRDWTKHRYYQWRSNSFDPPFDQTVNYSDE